jgi:hypothetical protein
MATPPKNQQPNRQQSMKEQRAQKRAEQLEALKKKEATQKRNRLLAIIGSVLAIVLIAGGVTAVFVVENQPPEPQAVDQSLLEGDYEDRLLTFDNLDATHVAGNVDYSEINPDGPPVGGPHNAAWLNCGVYDREQPEVNAVHSLEHGAVWFGYDPAIISDADLTALRALAPSSYSLVTPIAGLGEMMSMSAWGAQLRFVDLDDPAIEEFLEQWWRSPNAPEPNATCSGAYEGAGRVS